METNTNGIVQGALKILVIEDVELNESIVNYISDPYHCVGVLSLKEAKQAIEASKYDLIVSDLNVGDENGFEFIEEARKNGTLSRVLIMTGEPTIEAPVRAIKNQVDGMIPKPFTLNQLEELIGDISDRHLAVKKMLADTRLRSLLIEVQSTQRLETILSAQVKNLNRWSEHLASSLSKTPQNGGADLKDFINSYVQDYFSEILVQMDCLDSMIQTIKAPSHSESAVAAQASEILSRARQLVVEAKAT